MVKADKNMKQKRLGLSYAESVRISNDDLSESVDGKLFFVGKDMIDLSDMEIVNVSVDTIRQLYYGRLDMDMYNYLVQKIDDKDEIIELGKYGDSLKWHVSRISGHTSGYRLKVQSKEHGVVVLIGGFRNDLNAAGNHLKIELSPHFISERTSTEINQYLTEFWDGRGLAGLFLKEFKPSGVAVHIACDYQGAELPKNFLEHFKTRCRSIRTFHGLSTVDLSELSSCVSSYGKHEGSQEYLIGKADSLQISLYNKTRESVISDKKDYFEQECFKFNPNFDPEKVTRRLEVRCHHSVVREFGNSLGKEFKTIVDVEPYLTDIWVYALENNRLQTEHQKFVDVEKVDHETGEIVVKTYPKYVIHPLWQVFIQDVVVGIPANPNLRLKRKKKESTESIAKSIDLLVGNLVKIAAREGYKPRECFKMFTKLPIYNVLLVHLRHRGRTEQQFFQYIEKRMYLHRLVGKAA